MLLLYQTINSPHEGGGGAENCLVLDGPAFSLPCVWGDIRRRTHGLIARQEPAFVWTGTAWDTITSDQHVVARPNEEEEEGVLRVRLLPPLTGARFRVNTNHHTTSAPPPPPPPAAPVAAAAPLKIDDHLAHVGDSLRSTFSSLAKSAMSASDLVAKAVNDIPASLQQHERRVEQIERMRFRVGKRIAEGGFSEVFIAKEEATGEAPPRQLAIKRCLAQTPEQLDQLKREVLAHGQLTDCSYILQLLASEVTRVEGGGRHVVRFVFPLCAGGSWFDAITSVDDDVHVRRVLLGAAKALHHMHSKRMLHRDVKPHNILLTADGHPLLMDLGSACELPILVQSKRQASDLQEDAAQNCSAPYRAPELFEPQVGRSIGAEADVWSLGCALFAVVFGRGYSPFEDATQGVLKLAILNGSAVKFPKQPSSSSSSRELAQQIVARCVVHGQRITLPELIQLVEQGGE